MMLLHHSLCFPVLAALLEPGASYLASNRGAKVPRYHAEWLLGSPSVPGSQAGAGVCSSSRRQHRLFECCGKRLDGNSNPALLMTGTCQAQMLLSQHRAESRGRSQGPAFYLIWGFAEGMSEPRESLRSSHLQLVRSILRLLAGLGSQPCLKAWTAGTAPAAHPWLHLALLALLIFCPTRSMSRGNFSSCDVSHTPAAGLGFPGASPGAAAVFWRLEKPASQCQAWAGQADMNPSQSRQLIPASTELWADLDGSFG